MKKFTYIFFWVILNVFVSKVVLANEASALEWLEQEGFPYGEQATMYKKIDWYGL